MNIRKRVLTAIILILFIIISIFFLEILIIYKGKVLPGITIEGENVTGMNKEEVRERVITIAEKKLKMDLQLIYGEIILDSSYKNIGLIPDISRTVNEAFQYGRERSFMRRIKSLWKALNVGYDIPVYFKIHNEIFQDAFSNIKSKIYKEPRNARYVIKKDDSIDIIPDKSGQTVNKDLLIKRLLQGIKYNACAISIPVKSLKANITYSEIIEKKITGLLSEYKTYFNKYNINRTHNIKLAVKKLDGIEIPPKGVFSFNDVVGPRTEKRGFKEAIVIINNEFQPGLGGGICQVSSTLYNAVLLAGLEIKERVKHSIRIDYVPVGLDATVVYGLIDFKFKNNTDGFILIKSKVEDNSLIMKIYGNLAKKPDLKIIRKQKIIASPVKYIRDDSLKENERIVERPGTRGYIVEVYRYYYENEKVIVKEKISEDYYPPSSKVVRIGMD